VVRKEFKNKGEYFKWYIDGIELNEDETKEKEFENE
jgi:hypothetical protein